jgi:hypothetical protein
MKVALLCVMPFGLTIGRLTNDPTKAHTLETPTPTKATPAPTRAPCCAGYSSIHPDVSDEWCETSCSNVNVGYGLCKWSA